MKGKTDFPNVIDYSSKTLQSGDTLTLEVREPGDLCFFINGEPLGICFSDCAMFEDSVYPFVYKGQDCVEVLEGTTGSNGVLGISQSQIIEGMDESCLEDEMEEVE